MATFKSDMILKRTRVNTVDDADGHEFTSTFILPAGQQVTAGDIYQCMDISALCVPVQVRVYCDQLDDGTTLTTNWGYQQISVPVVPGNSTYGGFTAAGLAQDFDVATGTYYPSPATSASYYQSANAVVGRAATWSLLTLAAGSMTSTGAGGPIRTGFTINVTPTQTTSSAVQRVIRVQMFVERATPLHATDATYNGY